MTGEDIKVYWKGISLLVHVVLSTWMMHYESVKKHSYHERVVCLFDCEMKL